MAYISKNIRYLRRKSGFSQKELAAQLGTKRSNIASYESKDIEPRLAMLVKIARLFNVDFAQLIEADLSRAKSKKFIEARERSSSVLTLKQFSDSIKSNPVEFKNFVDRSDRVKRILEGFKLFFKYKMADYHDMPKDLRQMFLYVENFLELMERLLDTNEQLIKMVRAQHTKAL